MRVAPVLFLLGGCASSQAQSLATLQANYIAQKCGTFVSWNMTTFQPDANAGALGWATPNQSLNTFAPTVSASALQTNMNAWMAATVSAGCKYIVLTTKHHDGFTLWPTAFAVSGNSPYSIAGTTWYSSNSNPDLVSMFVTRARAYGLNPVLYFSIWDRTMEARDANCTVGAGSQPTACNTDYLAMIETELTELLSNYGAITAIWTDGWGWKYGHTAIPYSTIYSFIKGLQPSCLLIENDHLQTTASSDIVEYEVPNGDTISNTTLPGEGIDVIKYRDSYWFWNSSYYYSAAHLQPQRRISEQMTYWNTRNANYLLDIEPDTAGLVPEPEITSYSNWRAEVQFPTNLALGKTVSASSSFGLAAASTLSDGVLFGSSFFATSGGDTAPYVEVDLGTAQSVSRVELFNSTGLNDSYGRLRDLTVTLYDGSHSQLSQATGINAGNNGYGAYLGDVGYFFGPGQLTITLSPAIARYVRVARTPNGAADTNDARLLALMEIEVFNAANTAASAVSGKVSLKGAVIQ